MAAPIRRQPLRKEVRRRLIERLFSGQLTPGSQIAAASLANELGVSQTPLREALLQLEFEGFLRNVPGRGFIVRGFGLRELRELFALGRHLETFAFRTGGIPDASTMAELQEINERRDRLLDMARSRDRMVGLDNRWHGLLVSGCDNRQLREMLRLVRNRLYRYQYAFSGEREDLREAVRQHDQILNALRGGSLETAIELLGQHWDFGEATMRRLLESRSR